MINFRKSAIAAIAAIGVIGASAAATPSVANAGDDDLAKAIVGGLVVGTIAGVVAAQSRNNTTVIVEEPRPRFRNSGGFRQVSNNGFSTSSCVTREEITIDRFGNQASSLQRVCR